MTQPPVFTDVRGTDFLPENTDLRHVVLLVSTVAAETMYGMYELTLLCPDTGPGSVVRTDRGVIAGVRGFIAHQRSVYWHDRCGIH